jgi:hypothetical protein
MKTSQDDPNVKQLTRWRSSDCIRDNNIIGEDPMRVVQGRELPFIERTNQPRGGRFRQRRLLEGEPGSPGNFLLQNSETFGDFASPRHRHNFEQYRYQLRGTFQFDRDGTMAPGVVGYFPEGTPYGPQTSSEDSLTLVLQFGGASRNGYMSEPELSASVAALKQQGSFKNGVYSRETAEGGRINQDAYEAAWEHNFGRKVSYPPMRFQAPVFMNPEHFGWVQPPDAAGISLKHLGSFGECRTDIGFLKFAAGASYTLAGPRILYGLAGSGRIASPGGAALDEWQAETAIEIRGRESITLRATEPAELLFIGLPQLH